MNNYTVSVICPIYNAEKYIVQMMDSLVNQTLNDMEIIAVNGGSTDRTGEILDTYAEQFSQVKVIHQECVSQAHNVNTGLRIATGEYVAECDADDFASIFMYQKLYEAAEHRADVVHCGLTGFWADGKVQYAPLSVPEDWRKINPQELTPEYMGVLFGKLVSLPSGIYRREFILENELFWREGGQNYEDTNVAFKIRATATDYRFVDECLYYYRRDNPNSGSATIKDEFAICEQYEETERYLKERGLEKFMTYLNVRRYYDYIWSLQRTPDERKWNFVQRCQEDFRKYPADGGLFNTDEDFRAYCNIKYGAWRETGVLL